MTNPADRLNAALTGRYRIERFVVEIKTAPALEHSRPAWP